MHPEKQKTAKRHVILLAAGVLVLLSVLSLTTSPNESAPPLPKDITHQQMRKVEECLNCHANDTAAVHPMKHPLRTNCSFCHEKK
jgi:hypothetical protein